MCVVTNKYAKHANVFLHLPLVVYETKSKDRKKTNANTISMSSMLLLGNEFFYIFFLFFSLS